MEATTEPCYILIHVVMMCLITVSIPLMANEHRDWNLFFCHLSPSLKYLLSEVLEKLKNKFEINHRNEISFFKFCCYCFGTSKMHLSPPLALAAVRSKAVVLLLWTFCLLLLPLWESVIVLFFVVCYFMSILVLQSS